MIIQLLGVALISLLMITPTIQQNNIEQLIAPNIEIQPSTFLNQDTNRLFISKQFSHYDIKYLATNGRSYTSSAVYTNTNQLTYFDINATYSDVNRPNIYITDANVYVSALSNQAPTGDEMRSILREYYYQTRGSYPTSDSFSFTVNSSPIGATTTYYTYTLNGIQGSQTGRLYLSDLSLIQNFTTTFNANISIPQGSNFEQLIQAVNPQNTFNNQNMYNEILYYFSPYATPDLNTLGTRTVSISARTNFGVYKFIGNVNVTITVPDTTPPVIQGPTELTFEVGTYTLIEQLLNLFYTFTDNVGINEAYYTPITSINTVGVFEIVIFASDLAGNTVNYPVTITTTSPPPQDTTPPVISGSDTITRELGQVNNDAQLANQFNITDDFTQPSAIVKTITGTRSYTEAGTYNLTLTATDIAGNFSTKEFTFVINPPFIDNEPPVIVSDLIVSITVGDFTDRQEILDFYTTVTDNVALSSVLLVGDINFNVIGDYQLQIIATDTSQNQSTRNILIRIREEVILGNYNPLTDLLSGIFGGALSMIFTIGTINVLGLRLLDAMGVIILGAVLLFVYKAIKGGS
jgi:hypothetical protein